MEIRTLNCNCCGAPLVARDVQGHYVCSHCDVLHATFDARAAICGQEIDEIHQTTQQTAERLESSDLGRHADGRLDLESLHSSARRPNPKTEFFLTSIFLSIGIILGVAGLFTSGAVLLAGLVCFLAGFVDTASDKKSVSNDRRERFVAPSQNRPKPLDGIRRAQLH
jgi:hypothetical protein